VADPADDDVLAIWAPIFQCKIKIVIDDIDPPIFEKQVDSHARILLLKLRHDPMNVLGADAGWRVNAQQPFNFPHISADTLQRRLNRCESRTARIEQILTNRCRTHRTRRTFEQPGADVMLKIPELLGYSGLRHAKVPRRRRDRAALNGSHECTQSRGQVHISRPVS
jgi:hypothetical protein